MSNAEGVLKIALLERHVETPDKATFLDRYVDLYTYRPVGTMKAGAVGVVKELEPVVIVAPVAVASVDEPAPETFDDFGGGDETMAFEVVVAKAPVDEPAPETFDDFGGGDETMAFEVVVAKAPVDEPAEISESEMPTMMFKAMKDPEDASTDDPDGSATIAFEAISDPASEGGVDEEGASEGDDGGKHRKKKRRHR